MSTAREIDFFALVERAHDMAKSKGWWDSDRPAAECVALIHSELSEALEAYRDGVLEAAISDSGKPEGVPVELADAVIRVADMCGRWPQMLAGRSARGIIPNGLSLQWERFPSQIAALHEDCAEARKTFQWPEFVKKIEAVAVAFGLDLHSAIETKLEYNASRPHRHGGKKC